MPKRPNTAIIEKYLRKNDLHFQKDPHDKGLFRMGMVVRGLAFDLIIHDSSSQEAVLFLFPHIAFVPKQRRKDFAGLLSEVNYGLLLGSYEMDPADGEVRLKLGIPTDRTAVTEQQIDRCVGFLVGLLNKSFPQIASFVAGTEGRGKSRRGKSARRTKELEPAEL
jgi:hypothetical protein